MTKRSIIIGLFCSVGLCSATYFNQSVIRQSAIVGNYMPLSVYGTLIVVLVLVNPALTRLRPSWRLTGKELAVTLMMVLASCGIAESGFMKTFTNVLMLPTHYKRIQPGWNSEPTGTFARLPEQMIASPGKNDEALGGFLQSKTVGDELSLDRVPWQEWKAPLLTWLPFALLLIVGFIALGLVVHRQWSEHEKLPFPIATFTKSLLGDTETGAGSVLKERPFWIAGGAILGIHLTNYAFVWWPETVIAIPTSFDLRVLRYHIPYFEYGGVSNAILSCRLYFSVIGVAYLVSTDVSFSFALVPFVGAMAMGMLSSYGISFYGGGEHRASVYTSLNIGSFIAFVGMAAYFGRRHYWNVFRRSVGLGQGEGLLDSEVWGARVFMCCILLCIGLMMGHGLPLPFALLYMFMISVFYIGVSRVVAQTGLLVMKPAWVPHILLLGLFGGRAVGPTAALIAMFFSAVLFAEGRETVMPYICNSLNLLSREGEGERLGRIAAWAAASATIGLLVGLTVTLCLQYAHGTDMAAGGWFTRSVPSYPFEISTGIAQRLESQGVLEESDNYSPMERLQAIRPERKFAISFVVGAVLVVLCYIGRIRIANFPLNPAVFLLWSWYHCAKLTFSFFIGWAIKAAATRYGGWHYVQKVQVIMFGMIAGDMLGAFIPSLISGLYYLIVGEPPPSFNIMP